MKAFMTRRKIPFSFLLAMLITVSLLSLQPVPTAYGATITVTTIADIVANDGQCSLREAIRAANTNTPSGAASGECPAGQGSLDTILLGANTYAIATGGANEDANVTGDFDILPGAGPVEIVGATPSTTIIEAAGFDRIFHVIGAEVTLRNLTIQGGIVNGSGGGVFNQVGVVTLRSVIIRNNDASLNGGGVYNQFGTLSILDNSRIGGPGGGDPNTAINGGGIYTQYSSSQGTNIATITNSEISFNTATTGDGGGIYATDDGDLTITNSVIQNNTANAGQGGGIYSVNNVVTVDTTFVMSATNVLNNSAQDGGGIHLQDIASPTITGGSISNNTASNGTGGLNFLTALDSNTTTLQITDTVLDNNTSSAGGVGGIANTIMGTTSTATLSLTNVDVTNNNGQIVGGIFNDATGTLFILNGDVSGNDALGTGNGGGIANDGTATITNTTVSGNTATISGAGVSNTDTLTIRQSTISGNTSAGAGGGGGINHISGTLTLTNSTISGNSTAGNGGGLQIGNGTANINSVTIANNSTSSGDGGGVFNAATGTFNFANTIIATNTDTGGEAPNCINTTGGTFNSQDFNLIGIATGCTFTPNTNDQLGIANGEVNLQPLGDNGGPTQTHRLLSGSFAIDTGSCTGIPTDQRGQPRPVNADLANDPDPGDSCDIGAFEVQSLSQGVIGNFVWNDQNANGIQDAGEPGVDGVTVNLRNGSGTTILQTATTAGGGFYSFTAAGGNSYLLEFIPPANTPPFVFTLRQQGGDPNIDSDVFPLTGRTLSFPIGGGDTLDNLDAGIYVPGSIGDRVWLDTNGDGDQDVAETATLPNGIIIELYDAATDTLLTNTAPDPATGLYSFANLAPGDYYLIFRLPAGFIFTLQDTGGNQETDSDADPLTGRTETIPLTTNQQIISTDAGIVQLSTLTGTVWNDLDGDGQREVGENGLPNVTVTLLDENGNLFSPSIFAITNASGLYTLSFPPGTYIVQFTLLTGFAFSPQNIGAEATDSDPSPVNGRTDQIPIASGVSVNDLADAGMFEPATINGFVWNDDTDGDGIQDGGELGLLGAIVNVRRASDDSLFATFTTTVTGLYSFDVPAGSWIIEVVAPTSTPPFRFSPQNQGANDTIDSDVGQLTGRTAAITVAANDVVNDVDAGLHEAVTFTGFVWADANDDGLQSVGELGVQGVTVRLLDVAGTIQLATPVTTDAGGNYTFVDAPAGPSILEVVPPANQGFTEQDAPAGSNLTDNLDSDVNQFTGRIPIAPAPGTTDPAQIDFDAGLVDAVMLGDFVWTDSNGNGIQDGGEPGFNGMVVRLRNGTGATILATTITTNGGTPATDGYYSFSVEPGVDYIVEFVLPAGFTFSAANQGTDTAVDSDANPATGRTAVINLSTADATIDAGVYQIPIIRGIVWDDLAALGQREVGEVGLAGITVNVYDNTNALIATTTTSAGPTPPLGEYIFNNLSFGTYLVEVVLPANYGFAPENVGNDATDSDVNQFTGRTALFALAPNTEVVIDAGLVADAVLPTFTIGNFVWDDLNQNGAQDGGEPGVANVTVNLRDICNPAATPLATTITDTNGNYTFTANADDYVIQVIRPAGYAFTGADLAGDTLDSDITDTTNGCTAVFTLAADNDTIDAGLRQTASIGDFVWEDLNGNGIQDAGEPGIPNVTVRLLDTSLTILNTDTTDTNGNYSFDDLLIGDYIIQVVPPATFQFTLQDAGADTLDSDVDPLTGRTATITIASSTANLTVDAGLYRGTAVGDFAWNDANANGLQDGGEVGIANVTVNLTWAGPDGDLLTAVDNQSFVTTTNASGLYSFTNLVAGLYQATFIAPAGFTFTLQDVGTDNNLDSDPDATTGITDPFTLTAGITDLGIDAGFVQGSSIEGFVWDDLNADGAQDPFELGIDGVTVELFTDLDVLTDTVITAGGGLYTFADVTPGNYYVQFTLPAGYAFSPQISIESIDSDADPATGQTPIFAVQSAATVTDLADAGMFEAVIFDGIVWIDLDEDGIRDLAETGWNGVVINLYESDGTTLVGTTITANGGTYQLGVIGGDYILEVVLPSGFAFSPQDVGGDDSIDSDVDQITGRTIVLSPAVGTTTTIDAGIFQTQIQPLVISKNFVTFSQPVGIGDTIGWIICVLNPNASNATNVVVTDTVAASQTYVDGEFGLGSACPTTEPQPADYDVNPATALPAPPLTNISVTIPTLLPGDFVILYFTVTINDPGATFVPPSPDNGIPTGVMAMSTFFLALGGLSLRRRWLVALVLVALLLVGLAPMLYAQDSSDTTPQSNQEESGRWIRYEAGDPGLELNGFWERIPSENASGGSYLLSDDPDASISLTFAGTKVRVHYVSLWNSSKANLVIDNRIMSTLEDYSADNQTRVLESHEFTLDFSSHTLKVQSIGSSANPNAVIPVLAVDAIDVWLPGNIEAPPDDPDSSTLSGIVWADMNGNEQLDPADRLLEGVTVFLYQDKGANDVLLDSQVTDSEGRYIFKNLAPASYWVVIHRESLPEGMDRRSINWSPVDVTAPYDGILTIPSVPEERVTSQLSGVAWLDKDANNNVSDSDTTLAGVPVQLYVDDGDRVYDPSNSGDYVVEAQTTDASGRYTFGDLAPGIYWIVVDTENLPFEADSNQTWNLLWVRVPKVSRVDLLLVPAPETFSLGGKAWLDIDRNNQISEADVVLPGLSVSVFRDNGNNYYEPNSIDGVVNTLITDEAGQYLFDRLPAGIYWVIPDMDNLPAKALQNQLWPPIWVRVPAIETTQILLIPDPNPPDYPTGPVTVKGYVFNDDDGNRQREEGFESGIENAQVSLYYDDGNGEFDRGSDHEVAIAQTGADGQYSFEGLGEGQFWVVINTSALPPNYMDTVEYGGHGIQSYQELSIVGVSGTNAEFDWKGPDFAYALDTDGDGSPDGREGSKDRDNDNVPNYLDAFDPTGIVYAIDELGNTKALSDIEVRLVYELEGEWISADTIQPNPQRTGPHGEYRFDLNVTPPDESGIPEPGVRTFRLEVTGLGEGLTFPSELYAPDSAYVVTPTNGQITLFSEIPDEGSSHEHYLEFVFESGDGDVANNHVAVDSAEVLITAGVDNEACVNWSQNPTGQERCAESTVPLNSNVHFTLTPSTSALSAEVGNSVTHNHTIFNGDEGATPSDQSDRYLIEFPAGTRAWPQQLVIRDGSGATLTTLDPGESFVTPPIPPNAGTTSQILLEHIIDIPIGAANQDVDTTTIRVTSQEAADANVTLQRTATDTTTATAGCITGFVFNDFDNDTVLDPGEALANVRLFIQQNSTTITQVTTDGNGEYQVDLPAGSYTVRLDTTTLPTGAPVFLSPVTDNQPADVVLTAPITCDIATFRLNFIDPAISKVASVTEATPGQQFQYTIQIVNPTTSPALTNVTITDVFNPALTIVSVPSSITDITTNQQIPITVQQSGSTVTFFLGSLVGRGVTITLPITVRVNDNVQRPFTISNSATITYNNGVTETSQPVIVTIPASTTPGGDNTTDDSSDTGDGGDGGEDFGTGGPDVVGVGQEDTGTDTLPTTGYRPTMWEISTPAATQTAKLSTAGRLFVAGLAILCFIIAGVLFYIYNNSIVLYEWLQRRSQWFSRAIIGIVVLFLVFGSSGLIYTFNDIAGVVDVDKLVGFDDQSPDDRIASNEEDDETSVDNNAIENGVTWADGEPVETVSLPRLDNDTRRVIIPALNIFTKLVEAPIQGTTWDVSHFFDELAHLEGTPAPGTSGNTVIAGHVTHNRGIGPFVDLEKITPGAVVIIKDYDIEYTYVVNEITFVTPDQIEVTHNTKDAMLTLISCANWNHRLQKYTERIVVKAELYEWRILSLDNSEEYAEQLGEQARYEVGQSDEIRLTGEWTELGSFNTSNGSYFYSENKDAEINFSFTGDKFRLSYVMYNNFGIFDVYIDDKLIMTIDAYNPYSGFATTEVIQLPNDGRHRVRIVNTGKANPSAKGNVIGLDALDIWR